MEAALDTLFLSVEEYLAEEEASILRHEYVAGNVFAMAGGSDAHNTIALNLIERLRPHLRNGPCRLFAMDVKVRLSILSQDIFYYPDIMVTCDARDTNSHFKEYPSVIIEVLSETTERIDRYEKFRNYTQIETLQEYILVAQDRIEATIFRRSQGWKPELARARDQEIRLESLNFKATLAAIYEGVKI